jgi:hypothetical protein
MPLLVGQDKLNCLILSVYEPSIVLQERRSSPMWSPKCFSHLTKLTSTKPAKRSCRGQTFYPIVLCLERRREKKSFITLTSGWPSTAGDFRPSCRTRCSFIAAAASRGCRTFKQGCWIRFKFVNLYLNRSTFLIIEGAAKKVLQYIMPLKSIFNRNLCFVD